MKTISCMNIDPEILYKFGAEKKSYKQDEIIYREGDYAAFYYQIIKGKIKLNSYNEEGKEFIHNIIG
ncbi:cyclic nucleotide-binding domain-containing protein, partial [Chryseobacterium taichungense]|uniref:cyclic nucleotide-binding domain-containing protein n=1 Tax=Chryseobacterium taichungense TaxID=295069 RepID=UPI0028AB950D